MRQLKLRIAHYVLHAVTQFERAEINMRGRALSCDTAGVQPNFQLRSILIESFLREKRIQERTPFITIADLLVEWKREGSPHT